jgi:hypothetical protein
MKSIVIAALLSLVASPQSAKHLVEGIEAPDAVTLRVTKVIDVSEPEKITYAPDGTKITESASGNKVTVESDTIRYTLSCLVRERVEEKPTGRKQTLYDGQTDRDLFYPVCNGEFHVNDRVTFYSLENLVWLSFTRGRDTIVHGPGWNPEYRGKKFWTFKIDFNTPEMLAIDREKREQMMKNFGQDPGMPHHPVEWNKPYSIESEEEKKAVGAR